MVSSERSSSVLSKYTLFQIKMRKLISLLRFLIHANLVKKKVSSRFSLDSGCISKAAKILKLDIHRLYASIHTYKIIKINSNKYTRGSIDLNYPVHPYSTRIQHLLQAPFLRVNSVRSNFEHQLVSIWNSSSVTITT